MLKEDSGQVLALLIALVAGVLLAGVASLALTSSVAGTPDKVTPELVTYDAT